MNDEEDEDYEDDEDDEDDEWKIGISNKEIEKTDKMIDDLIDNLEDKRDDLSLDFITKLTKYFKNLLKSEK